MTCKYQCGWRLALCKATFALLLLASVLPSQAQLGLPPAINGQPTDVTVTNGGTASFTVDAWSLLGVTYKWYHNGVQISGANQSTLTINNCNFQDAGGYVAECRNLIGVVYSRTATLTVTYPALKVESGRMTPKGFRIKMAGPSPCNYIIWATSDMVNWTPISTNSMFTGGAIYMDPTPALNAIPATQVAGEVSTADATPRPMQRFYRASVAGMLWAMEENGFGGNKFDVDAGKKGAQSFKHGAAGDPSYTISKIVLRLSRNSNIPTGNLNFNIGTGLNSGVVAGTAVAIPPSAITNTSGGNSFQTYEIVYDTPVGPFAAGTTYYMNIEYSADASARFYWECAGRNSYGNGTYYEGGSNKGEDARFEIWGR